VGGRRRQASPKKRSRSGQQTTEGRRRSLGRERAERKEALERERATSEILRVIAESQTDAQPVFDTIVRNAVTLCGGMFANAYRYDGEQLHLVATTTNSVELRKILADTYPTRPDERHASGRAILARATVKVKDALADPAYDHRFAITGSWRRVLAVPMLRSGEPIGVIAVVWPNPGPVSKRQEQLLQTFAAQAVIAIENVRLFNEAKEALERQTATADILRVISSSPSDVQPVFEAVARKTSELCGGNYALVVRFDGELIHLAAEHNARPGSSAPTAQLYPRPPGRDTPSARAVLERAVVHIPYADRDSDLKQDLSRRIGAGSFLSVPLLREGEAIGAIGVSRAESGPLPDKQIELVKVFADQAVIAIENVRLFNETKEALEQQKASAEVLGTISSSIANTSPVFEKILGSTERLFAGRVVGINVLGEDGMIHLGAYQGAGREDFEKVFPLPVDRNSGSGLAIVERRVVHIPDSEADGVPEAARQGNRARGNRASLYAPMMSRDKAIGVIWVSRELPGPFSEKEIALLKSFADQAVIAIENARLFNETKEALEQQKASAEVLGTISSSIADTKPVFGKILDSCQRLFEGHQMGINLVGDDGLGRLAAYLGPNREEFESNYPIPVNNNSGTGRAIQGRTVVHFSDVAGGLDVPDILRRTAATAGIGSVIFAPMIWEGRGVGAIFVGRAAGGDFPEKAIRLLKTFADQAVIAIQNAHLVREIQEKSAQLEVANKHKSDFLANMSHELRTPLNAIIGFSEAMMEKMFGELNDKQLEYQKDIHESGKHLLSLINDILDLSKIEAGRMELELSSFHLPTAISNAVTLIRERAQRNGITLGVDIDPRLGDFQADERKVKQILLNLLSNAVKFTHDGGRVDLSAIMDTDKVEIAVKDTGVGIAPEDQGLLFEEFKQLGKDSSRKAEGTGLGLALTKRLVELHGGQILVDSAVGKGSTFRVLLPARN